MTTTSHWLIGTRTGLLVEIGDDRMPVVRAWGPIPPDDADPMAAVRALTPAQTEASVDPRVDQSLLPAHATGFQGSPGVRGSFGDGTGWAPDPTEVDVVVETSTLSVRADDRDAGLRFHVRLAIDDHDVVSLQAAVTNRRGLADDGGGEPAMPAESPGVGLPVHDVRADDYRLDALRLTLPVPDVAREVEDFAGRWIREMHPQRHDWQVGRVERVNVRGRTSQEDPPLMLVGERGFSHERGRVWAMHLGWSGNHEMRAERTADGFASLQAAEHLHPGEVRLRAGETYVSPIAWAVASTTGTNGISDAFHAHLRARPEHPTGPRPVTLNTWEAVYFDHDRDRLTSLVDVADDLGVERFVLDDGWFTERDDDTAGLGDWVVDRGKHPDGVGTLADLVRSRGMEFGLWVEPEMVNPASDLFRADPTVALARPGGPLARHQHVLDVARPDVGQHLRDRLEDALADARPASLKWDLNRDHVAAERAGVAGSHAQVRAAWALLDDLREAHPDLEVESCSSGGGRIDFGILARTSRVWASDCNDPVERQRIQQGLSHLLPPELVGSHVGSPTAHTTDRVASLRLRLATAFLCHLGIEWDVTRADAADLATMSTVIASWKDWREVVQTGRVVRVDHPDRQALVHGLVTPDRAVFSHVQLGTSAWARPAAVRCPGLVRGRTYRVETMDLLTDQPRRGLVPGWYADGAVELSGGHLHDHGVALHVHQPQTATVLSVVAVD